MTFNLEAAIIPGVGLGGLQIGVKVKDDAKLVDALSEQSPEQRRPHKDRWLTTPKEEMIVLLNSESRINALYACKGYKGFLFGTISVEMTYGQALELRPTLVYDECESCFRDSLVKGVMLKEEDYDFSLEEILNRPISYIIVHSPYDEDFG